MYPCWVIVVAVDREDRYGDVDIGIFIIHMIESSGSIVLAIRDLAAART